MEFQLEGFAPGEALDYQFVKPDGQPLSAPLTVPFAVRADGTLSFPYDVPSQWSAGRWALRLLGQASSREGTIFFCVIR